MGAISRVDSFFLTDKASKKHYSYVLIDVSEIRS
jgi:hypothetical protein